MNKAFVDFNWEDFPSIQTPINAQNLNKLNDAIDTIDDRVITLDSNKADNDAISDEVETLGSAAVYAHDADSFFLASDGKVYKATASIAIGTTITVGTNCELSNIVDNLGGGSQPTSSGHTIVDSNGTEYAQRSKLKFNNATVTDDSTNDETIVTPQGGGSSFSVLSQTLTAGNTTVTFTNIPTTGDYLIDFYTSTGIPIVSLDTSIAGQVTVEFESQFANVTVYCKIEEIPS